MSKATGAKKIKLRVRIRILEAQVDAEKRRNIILRILLRDRHEGNE
jgi:hypothetical protein